jgi:hypothetical protein
MDHTELVTPPLASVSVVPSAPPGAHAPRSCPARPANQARISLLAALPAGLRTRTGPALRAAGESTRTGDGAATVA